jgi:molybdate transport system ATP-binding protein
MLQFDLTKTLGEKTFRFSGEAPGGAITVILGRSGSGKTTLARLLAGILEPDSGTISCSGRTLYESSRSFSLAPEKRGVGFVFQDHRLLPHRTVRDNILLPVRLGGRSPHLPLKAVMELLQISRLADRYPRSLSGGEAQRVSLARAMMASESFLIMDEPLSSVDPLLRADLIAFFKRVPAEFSLPVLYITHSAAEARFLGDQALFIQDGGVMDRGPVRDVLLRNRFVQPFEELADA